MTKPIPIALHQTATGYTALCLTPGDPTPTMHKGNGDTPGEAVDQALESIVNCGAGHHPLWIRGTFTPDPAQEIG